MSTMDPPKSEGESEKPAIPTAMASTPTAGSQHPPPSPLSGCYLLVVLPEPHNAQHKDLILNRIAKGFLSWDKDNCHVDLEKELQALVAQAPEGEEARNGERLIQYATENLVTEILIHPQSNTLLQCIRNLLASFTKHRHIIHAGYTFSENGSWILQDGTFSLADFLDAFNEHDVQRVLRAYENSVTVDINCAAIGEWSMQRLSKEPCTRSCRVRLNPDDVLTAGVPAITSFTNYISQYLVPQALDQLMQPSDVVGNIRFSHPTLYVFPGGQGDAALFGINGFNMLVDGGFARKSCFWDFTRHLDRLDAVLLTRMNNSNVGGMSSVLRKKREMQVYPQIGHFFCNLVERKHSNSPDGDKDIDPLILSLTELGQEMMLNLKHINLRPHPCYRDPEPINLYHKVGHGTLDMYVLSPSKDSREVREFLSKWNAGDWKLLAGSHKKDSNNLTFPIQNLVSICALLVWQPANPEDTITRILFPGSTPQHKIFEGIERLRHLEFLKHPRCTAKSISPSASLVALKDKPMKIQKMSLMDRETKRAMEVRKAKREDETKQKIESTQPDKIEDKPKPIPKKREVVENKKIDSDIKENGMKDVKKIDKELKDVKETKKIVKDDVKKTEMMKTKMETEKTALIKETKTKLERKEKKIAKDPAQKVPLPKPKLEEVTEKKTKAPIPKKIVNGALPKPEDKGKAPPPKPGPKAVAKSFPAAAPKSAKDANNRKVVEQKNIERMGMSKTPAKPKAAPPPPTEKKPVPRRPKPAGSPSKAKFIAGSPIKSAKSTPTASVKSDKDGVIRKIKTEKETADSSTVSTPSAIEIDSMNKFTDKCLTEKSEDMSLDSIESKVLADLKEERQVVEEIEAVLQKAERIEDARKESRIEGEDEVTGEATDKKDITEDMTEDDVTADIDEIPQKTPTRKASQEQLTEEEDEYLIIEKEEGDTEDSVRSGEAEHKHFLDAVQSEKEKILKDSEEYDGKEEVDDVELEPEELEEEDVIEEKEVAEEKGIVEEREKSDNTSENKSKIQKTPDNESVPLAEYKDQLKEEMKGIITSATEIVQRTEEKDDSGKKDSEDITKEPSSPSPEKLDSSEKKTTDTDIKPEGEKIKEKMEESQERISTIESGATTTAPTLPEDERISIDVVKPTTTEKTIEDKKAEVPEKPKEILPLTTEPTEVKPEVRMFNVRQGPQTLQRDIVKTPDEVADLPVHEEVDPKLYKMDDFEKSKEEKTQVPTTTPQDLKESSSKEQKGVFSFFGKVADKFERGMDKLTGKGRRDSEKDVDEKSSSKSGSLKDEHRPDITPAVVSDIQPAKIEEKEEEKESIAPLETTISAPPPPKSPKSEEKVEGIPLDGLQKSTDAFDDLEDADEVEALLEESSKKFKTVKDSLRDSLESLEEKIVEEEFKRAAELVASTKDDVKDTLEEVVEKLEGIKPQIDGVATHEKGPDKVHFDVPADDDDSGDGESTDHVRDLKEAVREVGEVLAGTAGIILEDKPKDVIEIVKKVAEVLKEDDFLSEKVLFKASTESLAAEEKIEELVGEKSSPLLECKEEPCIKKTIGEQPVISPSKEKTLDDADAKAICEDLMNDTVSTEGRKRSVTEHEGVDVLESGIEEVCQKVELPECQEKQDSPEVDRKEDRRDSMEIGPSQISLDHKIAPTTAEYVMVTPDSLPPSPKFPNVQSHMEKEMITAQVPRPGLPVEVENIIESAKTIDEIIEQLVFVKNKKITVEIIEYIILIKRVPRKQIIHIIQEIIIKKKVPRESVVADADILQSEAEMRADNVELGDEETSVDIKGEAPKKEDNLMTTDGERAEVEAEILQEYVTKNKKITHAIIKEIHVERRVPIYIIMEIIEYMIIKKKFHKQSIVDIDDTTWAQLKTEYTGGDEEEGKSVDEDQQPEDFIMVPSAEEVENIHFVESDVLDNYIGKGKKITREIIEAIHITRKIPIYVVIEIIEKIIITKKLQKHLTIDMSESAWNDLKSEALKEEKRIADKAHDGFEAVEQEYKFSEQKEQQEETLDDDTSEVIEADEKLIDKTFMDKSQGSVTLDEKVMTEQEVKEFLKDRKLSVAEVQKQETKQENEDTSQLSATDEVYALQPDKDADSITVRRMIVTTTSEDGGDEIVICPVGSITFGKSTSPEDSLRGSPLKTEPDKDSLHSHESTPEKDSISGKDSLDKSPPSIRDSQTLEDSIEKSKTDEKMIHDASAHTIEDKAIKDLHLDEIHKQPSDFGKTDDASPAESVFAESPLKESPKSDVVDAKPIPDDNILKQDPKDEARVVPSPVQVANLDEDTSKREATSQKLSTVEVVEKDIIDVVLDKSRSSSIVSLTQDETTPAPMNISRKESTISQEPIVKVDGGDMAHDEISKTPITAPSSDDVDLTMKKGSAVDVEKDRVVMQGLSDQPSIPGESKLNEQVDDELTNVQTNVVSPKEKEELKQNLDELNEEKVTAGDRTLDLKMEGTTSEKKSPSPGLDGKQAITSPGITTVEKDSMIHVKKEGEGDDKMEKRGSIVAISPIPKESPISQGDGKLSETQDELNEKENIQSPTPPAISSRKESLVQEKGDGGKSIESIDKTPSMGVTSPLRKESITLEHEDEKTSKIDESNKSPISPMDISPIREGSFSGEKDSTTDTAVSTIQMSPGKQVDDKTETIEVIDDKTSTPPKEHVSLDSKGHTAFEDDVKHDEIGVGAQADGKKSQTPSPSDVKSSKSSREPSPIRQDSLLIESEDAKAISTADEQKSPASSVGDVKSTKPSRDVSPVRKESVIAESDLKTKMSDKKSPASSVSDAKSTKSSRDASPVRKESLMAESHVETEISDNKSPTSSVADVKSTKSSRDVSPVRKESVIAESDVITGISDKKSPASSVSDAKSTKSSRDASPVRKESLMAESHVETEMSDKKSPASSVGDVKSTKSSRDVSPVRKESVIADFDVKTEMSDKKSPTSSDGAAKSAKSSRDVSPVRKESLIAESHVKTEISDKKSPVSSVEDVKSTKSSRDVSPVRKESVIAESGVITGISDKKSPASSVSDAKSTKSSRDASPVRKESLMAESHVKTEMSDKKSPASSVGDVKSTKSSRDASPVRKESLMAESHVKTEMSDKKSPASSVGDVKSTKSSRDVSPVRKESVIAESDVITGISDKKSPASSVSDAKSTKSSRDASPVRKESLMAESHVKTEMSDKKSPASSVGDVKSTKSSRDVSPVRKESVIAEFDVKTEMSDKKSPTSSVGDAKSAKSSRDVSPVKKESLIAESHVKTEISDKKSPVSSVGDAKSTKSSRDVSPVRKESVIVESDVKPGMSDKKSPAPSVGDAKSAKSSRDISPVRKESLIAESHVKTEISDNKSPTSSVGDVKSTKSSRDVSPVRKESVNVESDVKPGMSDKKSPAPSVGDAKSAKSSRDASPVRKESLIAESHVKTEISDKKSPVSSVGDVKSTKSSRDVSPVRKESVNVESDVKPGMSDKKSPAPSVGDAKSAKSSRDASPVREESLIAESHVKTEISDKKSPVSSVGDVKSTKSSRDVSPVRKESVNVESDVKPGMSDKKSPAPSVGDAKSAKSSRDASPVRKESLIAESHVKTEISDNKLPTSSVGDVKSTKSSRDVSPVRKESVIAESDVITGISDKKSPASSISDAKSTKSSRDASPVRKESLMAESHVKTETSDIKSPASSVGDVKSAKSSRDVSPVRKESVIAEFDVKTEMSDKKSPTSSVGDAKSAKSSRDASPVRKESLIAESHVKTEMSDKKSPASSVGDAKSAKSSRDASPVLKENLHIESKDVRADDIVDDKKSSASSVGDVKSMKSSGDVSPVRKESVIVESDVKPGMSDKKSPAPSVGDAKSAKSSRDASPVRKESLIAESYVITEMSDKKSPASSVGDAKSAKSSRDASPVRKENLHIESKDVRADGIVDDKKSPASSVGDVKSTKSSRDASPVRKESVIIESDIKSEISDKKFATASVTDAMSPLPSSGILPSRKGSLTIGKLGEENVMEKSDTVSSNAVPASPSAVLASPIRIESISRDEKEKSPESEGKKDEKIAASPVGSISPVRKDSLIVDEKELSSVPRKFSIGDEHGENIDSEEPPKSPYVSPIRKESISLPEEIATGKLEDGKAETGIDKESPSPAGSVKSPASPQDISPIRKESVVLEEKVSASPRLSIDIKSEEKIGDAKSPSPLAASIKSSTSPGETSLMRKESLVSDKVMPTSDLKGGLGDLTTGDVEIDRKTSSPITEKKSSVSHQDTSSIRKESTVLEENILTPRSSIDMKGDALSMKSVSPTDVASTAEANLVSNGKIASSETLSTTIDLKPEDVGSVEKSSSPGGENVKSSMSPRETSPTRKESIALSEMVSASPRASIDIKHDGTLLDTKSPSPESMRLSLRDASPVGETPSVIVGSVSPISIATKDSEPDENCEKSSSPDEKISISGTQRASIDMKLGERSTDKETPSDMKTSSPDGKVSISGTPRVSVDIVLKGGIPDEKVSRPDDKVSISDSPRASIDIKHEDLITDKETPSDQKTSSPVEKVSVSDASRASVDISPEGGAADKKPSSLDDKVSISGTPRASMDMNLEEETIHKKASSPDGEALASSTPRTSIDITLEKGTTDRKKSILDEKLSVSGTPRASIDINLGEETIDKKTPSPDEKVSISDTPRASIDISLTTGTSDKKTPSVDEKISIGGTPRASVDILLAEGTADEKIPSPVSVSPSTLSPVTKESVSEKFDDKTDEKSLASAETRKESISGDGKQVIGALIPAQRPDDSMDSKFHSKESPTASVVDPKSATPSQDVSSVRKESSAQVLHQPEEKKIDVKSSASSRDSSPIRKDSLIPEVKEKSPEPPSLTPQTLPTPEEKPDVKSSESHEVLSPAKKESSTADTKQTLTKSSTLPPQADQKLGDDKVGAKSSTTAQETLPATKESPTQETEEKSLELSGLISHVPHKQEDKVIDTKSPPSQSTSVPETSPVHTISEESLEPLALPSQPKSDDLIQKDMIEKDLSTRSRTSSIASQKSTIVPTKDEKAPKPETLHQLESSLHVEKSKSPSSTDSSPQKLTSAVGKPDDVEFSEVPSHDRSRSHSLFETGEKTPLGRSRAASLFEEKEDIVKAVSRKSSGLSEFHEDHFQREDTDEDYQVSEAKRIDLELYIMSQYVTRKRKIIGSTLEEMVALYDVPTYIVMETIYEICEKMKIPRESIIDDVSLIEKTTRKSSAIKEGGVGQLHQFETYKEYSGTASSITQYKEEHMSGKSSPERRSSGYSTPEVRHYDDKYESQFHKAFVGGMTEIRTTHITTLSGKSTPDVGTRIDTPDSLGDTATSSDKMGEESMEAAPTAIKRTIITEVPEHETIVKKTIVKREIFEENDDDDGSTDGKSITTTKFDDRGVMKVDLNKSLMSLSSGRSTPDRIRDSSEGRSSTATPDSLRSHEVIKTTITKTRTMSDEGEIVTTTKEVTETTNERGETIVVEEKVDVKTTQVEPGMEISAHHWSEQLHREDSEEDSPLSATSQVYHYDKGDQKHVEFSTADMSSSFYGKLPDIPQPRHSTEPVGDDKDFSFKKFALEKHFAEGVDEHMSTSRQFADVADYDVDKVLKERGEEHHGDDEDGDKDPIEGWGTPLKLPSPERPDKFNLRSIPIVRSSVDMSPDSLNFDVINDWGEPLRLPSPAPTADEASNKTMPPTPKKERRQPKKIVAENMKNKKRSDSPANMEKKKDSKKVQPVYLDLTYVPHHGNSYYASLDFFKRIRARYYVFSGTEPSREVYDALLDAKKTWENKNLEVTMIPTYDTDTLGYWVADNEEALAANHIDLSPSASRCTINLQDHETSCSAYRLEF